MASVMGLPPGGMSRVTNHALARATAAGGRNRSSRFRAMQANIHQVTYKGTCRINPRETSKIKVYVILSKLLL